MAASGNFHESIFQELELADYIKDVLTGKRAQELISKLKRTENQLWNVTSRLFSLSTGEDRQEMVTLVQQQRIKMQFLMDELAIIQNV
jgi:division protein CdvB (Snf7/Vps24/ESCRT-III family)